MPRGGSLVIETANRTLDGADVAAFPERVEPGEYLSIAVMDTGAGMDAETQARAFDPFFTTKEVGKGTGLGLSQVYGFCRQSGGHAQIESSPGRGTTVRMFLPRQSAPHAELAERVRSAVRRRGRPRKHSPRRGRRRGARLRQRSAARSRLPGRGSLEREGGALDPRQRAATSTCC